MRKFLVGVAALVIAMGALVAEEYRGQFKSVDADKGVLTITVKDGDNTKDMDIKINENTKITAKNKQSGEVSDVEGGWKSKRFTGEKKPFVTVVTEKKDGKEIATEVKLGGGKGKKKDK